ncbi:hypothetical protein KAT92_06355 [Candidatus Babeliales bacterium]|nr:hypothetical protein [Candidatus Babeliales bacterium]
MAVSITTNDDDINRTILLMQLRRILSPLDFDKLDLKNLTLLRDEVKSELDKIIEEDNGE